MGLIRLLRSKNDASNNNNNNGVKTRYCYYWVRTIFNRLSFMDFNSGHCYDRHEMVMIDNR